MKVYVDMDGVLADFFGAYAKAYHKPVAHWKEIPLEDQEPLINSLKGTDVFDRLSKFNTADTLIQYIVEKFGEYSILSSPIKGDEENCIKWKNAWLVREMKVQPVEAIFDREKYKWAVDSNGPNILIDDRVSNLDDWIAKGGIGIRYQADEDNVSDVIIELEKLL